MAVRFDASGDRLTHASNPTLSSFTWMAWVRIAANNVWGSFFSCLGGNLPCIQTYDTDLRLVIGEIINNSVQGSLLSLNTWYHIAWVRASITNNKAYLNGILDIDDTSTSIGNGSAGIEFANQGTAPFNGRICVAKLYDNVQLTQAEIRAEMYKIRPVRTANLWAWWPMYGGDVERLRDYSLNARNLTAAGTLTDEAGPPLPIMWDYPRRMPYKISAALNLQQHSFRWRNDDGDEDGATWKAGINVDSSAALNANTRLRLLLNATGNPDPGQYQLEARKVGESEWVKVEA